MNLELKYGSGFVQLKLPDEQSVDIYQPKQVQGVKDIGEAIKQSLANPMGTERLSRLAKPQDKVVVVVDDVTRAVPSAELLAPIVDELNDAGVPDANICVIVATGLHRQMRQDELDAVMGPLRDRIDIYNHDPECNLEFLGRTRLGTEVYLNKTFLDADLKILTGDVEFHQFCGYGGGAKSVHPGLADSKSICLTHSRMDMEGTGPGRIEGNPVREDIDEVGILAGVNLIVNVVLNPKKEIVAVFSGDVIEAFRAAIQVCDDIYCVQVPEPADVVIASAGGFPKDIQLYQAQKAIHSAVRMVKKGGKIIVVAECREGHGSDLAYTWAKQASSVDDILARIKERFVMGGHKAYQLAMAAKWADIYLLSSLEDEVVEEFFLKPLSSSEQINTLISIGEKVAVLPQATLTVAKLKGGPEYISFGLPERP